MKFLLTHNAQGKTVNPAVPLQVEPEPRSEYINPCACKFVFVVAPSSVPALVERGLVLEAQVEHRHCVCGCLGVLQGRAKPHMPALARPLCAWDCETTGVDAVLDRLCSLGVTVLNPDHTRRRWETLINPEIPIPPEVTAIHGITDEMVKDAPKFRDIAQKFVAGLAGKDFLLYNGRRLDLPVVDESLRREGLKLNLEGVRVIDAFGIFSKKERRDLSTFVEKFTGRSHEGAHGAAADAEGTLDGWLGMMGEYPDIQAMSLDEQATYCLYGDDPDRLPADLAGKLYLKDGEVYFGFGKSKDKRVADDPGYASWILRATDPPFPGSTRDCLRAELNRLGL